METDSLCSEWRGGWHWGEAIGAAWAQPGMPMGMGLGQEDGIGDKAQALGTLESG
jgi:hypothetical protein